MIGWYVLVWTADDFVFLEPILVQRTQYTENGHGRARTKDIINDALKVETVEERSIMPVSKVCIDCERIETYV